MSDDNLHLLVRGESPLLINVPHAGTRLPPALRAAMTPAAQRLPDTDWHVPFLYQYALTRGATLVAATHSRYVVDLNRDPDDAPLYPDRASSALCPLATFAGEPIWLDGQAPDAAEVFARRERYWQPYHAMLRTELDLIRERNGYAILLDAHSVRSQLPLQFEGRLPDLNLGSFDGASCAPGLQARACDVLARSERYSSVLNGRYSGGYITRHYGHPERRIHALQLEIVQACYLDESDPERWDPVTAAPLIALLREFVDVLLGWRPPR